MPPKESESPLETLRQRLYTPGPLESSTAPELRPEARPSAPPQWAPPPAPPPLPPHMGWWQQMPWTSRFLVIAIGFFVIAGLVAASLFFLGSRSISSQNVRIDTQGPVSIGSGDTVAIVITIKNDNPATITNTSLVVDLPEGTRQATDKTQPLDHYTDTLGDLGPGQEASRTVNAVLFGAQNQTLTVPIRVEYRAEGSNAQFVTEGEYSVTITTSPLALTVSGPDESATGQPLTISAVVRSNAATTLDNVVLEVNYPPGYVPRSTTPAAAASSGSGATFEVGTLRPGEQRTFALAGTLSGSDSDERVFRLAAGTKAEGQALLPYASTDRLIRVARPFLSTTLSLNRETSDPVLVPPGQSVSGSLTWQNNLTAPVSDAQISVKFTGSAFDPAQVYTQSGFYRSSDATILFSKDTNRSLAQLLPGDTGTGAFSFTPKSAAALAGVPNPTVVMTVSIAGNRVSEGRVPEVISSTVTRTVKVGTDVTLDSRVLRRAGPFSNTGPVPPRPDVETTYTIELSAVNSVNSLGGAQVSMTLPSYARFTGTVSPVGSVTYDDRTRTVYWRINDLAPGAAPKAYFQVAFLPSISQVSTSPMLVSEQFLTGTDRFTKQEIRVRADRLTTQFPEDSSYQAGQGLVTK